MPRYDARQLLDNIERLTASAADSGASSGANPGALPSPRLDAPQAAPSSFSSQSSPPSPSSAPLPATPVWDALGLTILPSMRQHMRVDKVPEDARMAAFKKAIMRALRLVSGPQAAYNHFAISAIEVLAQHLDALRGRVEADAVERMRLAESLGARIDSLAGMQEQLGKGIEEVSGRVQAAHDSIRDQANSIWKSLEERDKRASDQARAASDQAAALWKAIEGCSARDKDLWKGIEDANARIGELHQSIQDRSDAIWKGVEGNTARAAQLRQSLDEQAQALWKGIEDANARAADFYKSLEDGASALWKSLAERGDQMQRQLEGIRACHASISALDAALRELRAKFLALNEEVVQLREEGGAVSRAAASEAPMPSAPLACEPQFGGRESTPPSAAAPPEGADAADSLDSLYLRFQRQFRGDEAMLRERQRAYVERLEACFAAPATDEKSAPRPPRRILDLACGDGIFIELLRERRGWDALGVDLNRALVRLGRERGLPIEYGDAFAFLDAQPAASWDAISALQFVEHLEMRDLMRLFRAMRRVLRPGGVCLVETLNPHTILAHKWFHLDLTHRRLIFPEVLEMMFETAGLEMIEWRAVSDPAAHERLSEAGLEGAARENAARLNAFLFGPQDYYALARKPSR